MLKKSSISPLTKKGRSHVCNKTFRSRAGLTLRDFHLLPCSPLSRRELSPCTGITSRFFPPSLPPFHTPSNPTQARGREEPSPFIHTLLVPLFPSDTSHCCDLRLPPMGHPSFPLSQMNRGGPTKISGWGPQAATLILSKVRGGRRGPLLFPLRLDYSNFLLFIFIRVCLSSSSTSRRTLEQVG